MEDYAKNMLSSGSWSRSTCNYFFNVIGGLAHWQQRQLKMPEDREAFYNYQRRILELEKIRDMEGFTIKKEPVRKALTLDELGDLINEAKARDFQGFAFTIALSYFGLRRKELTLLTLDDVDLNHRRLEIREQTTKTAPRFFYFNPKIGDLLLQVKKFYQVQAMGQRLFSVTGQTVYDHIKKFRYLFTDPKLKLTPHSLRYTFITHMQNRLRNPVLLKFLSGHQVKNRDMTALYTQYEANPEPVKTAMLRDHYFNQLGEWWK